MSNQPLILALDSAGNPIRWIDYERAAYLISKDRLAWTPAEADVTLHGGVNAISGNRSTLTMPMILAIKGKSGKMSSFKPRLTKRGLHRRDNNLCCYCNQRFSDVDLTGDHVHPAAQNGATVWENMVSACFPCNNKKGNRTPEQAKMKMHFQPRIPTRAEYLYFINLNKLECQVAYLDSYMGKHR